MDETTATPTPGGAVAAVDRQLVGARSVAPQRWDGGTGGGSGGGVERLPDRTTGQGRLRHRLPRDLQALNAAMQGLIPPVPALNPLDASYAC